MKHLILIFVALGIGCGSAPKKPDAVLQGRFQTPFQELIMVSNTGIEDIYDTAYVSFLLEFSAHLYKGDHAYDIDFKPYLVKPPRVIMNGVFCTDITVVTALTEQPNLSREVTP